MAKVRATTWDWIEPLLVGTAFILLIVFGQCYGPRVDRTLGIDPQENAVTQYE